MRISDWSSYVCSSDLERVVIGHRRLRACLDIAVLDRRLDQAQRRGALLVAAFHGGDQRSLDIVANHVPAPREKLADSPAGDILTGLTRGRHSLRGSVLASLPPSIFG